MRLWTFAVVPLFAALTVWVLRVLDVGSGTMRSQASSGIGMAFRSPRDEHPRRARIPAASMAAASGFEPPNPIVDFQSLSDLERAVIETRGPDRGRIAVTLELTKSRLIKLLKRGRDFCQKAQPGGGPPARPGEALPSATETDVEVSAWVETAGRHIRLSKLTVAPWRGAALQKAFSDCIQSYAVSNANAVDPESEGPFELKHPPFSGTYRMVVSLKTTCAEVVTQ
jgi:hypothetical protein